MKHWSLGLSRDGYSLELAEYPAWAGAVEAVFFTADRLARHRLCNPPEWSWRIPLWPGRDGDLWEHSLGGVVWRLWQWGLTTTDRHSTDHSVPITRDQAAAIDPRAITEWDDLLREAS